MTTSRFTPGPWRIQVCTGPARGAFNLWAGDAVVAGVPHPDQPYSGARSAHEAKGNAHLIAAAPDLYEALRSFVSPSYEPPAGVATLTLTLTLTPAEYRAARAALAKVEGK